MPQVTLTFTKKEVEDILRRYAEKQTGTKMKEANVKVRMEYEDRPCGGSSPVFEGYDIVMQEKSESDVTELYYNSK